MCGIVLPIVVCSGADAATHKRHHRHHARAQTTTDRGGHHRIDTRPVSRRVDPNGPVIRGS